jgi:hypothetical protein
MRGCLAEIAGLARKRMLIGFVDSHDQCFGLSEAARSVLQLSVRHRSVAHLLGYDDLAR